MKKFNAKKEQTWTLKISGSKDASTANLKEQVKEEMWKGLCDIIPKEFRHAVKESFKSKIEDGMNTVEYSCVYKPLI